MRKATAAVLFALLVTVSVSAAPNDSSDRDRGVIHRIVHLIKKLLPTSPSDDPQGGTPIPPKP